MCSVLSLIFVSFKGVYIFSNRSGYVAATEIALFVCSYALAVGHIVVAYRTSCRERRKLLVYKIDMKLSRLAKMGIPFPDFQLTASTIHIKFLCASRDTTVYPKDASNLDI
ncbi:hypothetical protein SESBI_43879 [Sesbania bispinosa]|nr:hypothetical protein SESBI_43879 [Sesbania bispinosa]